MVNLVCLGPTRNVNDGEWMILSVGRRSNVSANFRDFDLRTGGACAAWDNCDGWDELGRLTGCGTHLLKSRESMEAAALLCSTPPQYVPSCTKV